MAYLPEIQIDHLEERYSGGIGQSMSGTGGVIFV